MEGSSAHWYIPVLSIVDQSLLNIHSSVLVKLETSSLRSPRAVVGIVNGLMEDERLKAFKVDKKPMDSFLDIGGLAEPIRELKETVELPLTQVIFKLNKLYIFSRSFLKIWELHLQKELFCMENRVQEKLC